MQIAQCYIQNLRSIKKIIMEKKIWGIPKNTEVEERLAQKKEELEKEINENKFQLVNISKEIIYN